jgi:hypothetical protein
MARPVSEEAAVRETGHDEPLFVYGVLRAGSGRPDCTGLDGAPVQLVEAGDLAAAVTPFPPDRSAARRADLTAYQAVLDALAGTGAVVPVRFGSVLADADAVAEDLLVAEHDRFAALLDRFDGRHQYNLRATYVEDAVLADLVAADPEIRDLREQTRLLPEYASLRDRIRLGELVATALEHRSAQDASSLLESVLPLSVDHVVRTPPSANQVLDVALLVDDSGAPRLVDALEALAEAVHERILLRLVGPLAPFDFVGAEWD